MSNVRHLNSLRMKTRHIVLAAASTATLMLVSCTSTQPLPSSDKQVPPPTSAAPAQPSNAPARPAQACQALADTARLRGALAIVMLGDEPSFQIAAESSSSLVSHSQSTSHQIAASKVLLLESTTRHTNLLLAKKGVVLKVKRATESIRLHSPELLAAAKAVTTAELMDKPPPQRIAATDAMEMLSERLGKSASELISSKGIDAESIFLLRKDTEVFQQLLAGMLEGNAELRLRPAKTPAARDSLAALRKKFAPVKEQVDVVLSNFADLVAAREAQAKALIDADALDRSLRPECLPQ